MNNIKKDNSTLTLLLVNVACAIFSLYMVFFNKTWWFGIICVINVVAVVALSKEYDKEKHDAIV